jgi:hypothetical protein
MTGSLAGSFGAEETKETPTIGDEELVKTTVGTDKPAKMVP